MLLRGAELSYITSAPIVVSLIPYLPLTKLSLILTPCPSPSPTHHDDAGQDEIKKLSGTPLVEADVGRKIDDLKFTRIAAGGVVALSRGGASRRSQGRRRRGGPPGCSKRGGGARSSTTRVQQEMQSQRGPCTDRNALRNETCLRGPTREDHLGPAHSQKHHPIPPQSQPWTKAPLQNSIPAIP